MSQKDDQQFETFKASLARCLQQTTGLVDRVLADESAKGHLSPLVPWVSEVMSASMEREFVEKVALAYWSRMGMTETSTPARLKIMELDGLSEAVSQSLAPDSGATSEIHLHLLEVCSFTVGSLLDAIGEMFPLVRGILRSTQDAIDVARS
ncbi:hypothetical protein [Hydrogenophaga sp. 5NK40-0174]|uniref:hypothetical protein n=1 Tax=Hydrogenophaga sp. 5NK40-0174 TaxID=3127649 RepID=UPI003108A925